MIAARNPSSLKGNLGCDLYSGGLAWTSAVLLAHGYAGFLCLGKASKDALAVGAGMGWSWGCGVWPGGCTHTGSAQRLSLISTSRVLSRGGVHPTH